MNIFNFDSQEIQRYIQYNMKLFTEIGKSFEYVLTKLVELNQYLNLNTHKSSIDLNTLNWSEGKNYNWLAVTSGDVQLLIRTYGTHFTIYTKLNQVLKVDDIEFGNHQYGAFTFHSNRNKLSGEQSDFYIDNPFYDLNALLLNLIEIIGKDEIHTLWNPCSFERPEHCEVKNIYHGNTIDSIDSLVFCAEELSNKHMELFAENNMYEILKGLKNVIGKQFDSRNIITNVRIEFPKQYSNPYYHGIGIEVTNSEGKKDFHDVYRLTYYYMEKILELMKY